MAKQSIKQQVVRNHQGQGHSVEQVFDDNLLPDASEIQNLHVLDPNILEWLKQCAEKEQNFRHIASAKRIDLVKKTEIGERTISIMGLIFSFLLVLSGMFFSGFLIHTNHEIIGSD